VTSADALLEERNAHELLLYRDQAHHDETVSRWVDRGVQRGEKVVFTTEATDLGAQLARASVDVTTATRLGQCVTLTPEALLSADGQTAVIWQALEEGYSGVRVTAQANEVISVLGNEGYQRFHRHLDQSCDLPEVSALCRYQAGQDAPDSSGSTVSSTVGRMVRIHPDGVDDGTMRARRRGNRMELTGEVDLFSAGTLTEWLFGACSVADREVVLDVTGLTFIDVAGCRALVSGTVAFRDDAGTVFLRGASGHTQKVMVLLGFGQLPGMRLP